MPVQDALEAHAALIAVLQEVPELADLKDQLEDIVEAALVIYEGAAPTPAQAALLAEFQAAAAEVVELDASDAALGLDLWPLRFFVGLVKLNVSGAEATDLSYLDTLVNLEEFVFQVNNLDTLDTAEWANLVNLKKVDFTGSFGRAGEGLDFFSLFPLKVVEGLEIVTDFGVFVVVDGELEQQINPVVPVVPGDDEDDEVVFNPPWPKGLPVARVVFPEAHKLVDGVEVQQKVIINPSRSLLWDRHPLVKAAISYQGDGVLKVDLPLTSVKGMKTLDGTELEEDAPTHKYNIRLAFVANRKEIDSVNLGDFILPKAGVFYLDTLEKA